MKRVFIDMDNVLVDFQSGLDQVSEEKKAEYAGRLDEIQGLFALMKPMPGAIEAVRILPVDVFLSKDNYEILEKGEIIAHYESMEELIEDGWILD